MNINNIFFKKKPLKSNDTMNIRIPVNNNSFMQDTFWFIEHLKQICVTIFESQEVKRIKNRADN